MKRNPHLNSLKSNYLFPEITLRKELFLEQNPKAALISLGIGDTTEPIPKSITDVLAETSAKLATHKGYFGYGPEQGIKILRERIASKIYNKLIPADDIFISDGAKCDISRLQVLFGNHISVAVQDPTYPVYVDGSIVQGVKEIIPMPCTPENNFFPNFKEVPRTDLIYFCSPNNPTGAVATKSQLEELVRFAKANRSIIIFDSAYANFIQDPSLPKSIYEIEGAKEVAIEVNSFSKLAGFTGVRLGWTVIPAELKYDDHSSIKTDWNRIITTLFNGASIISQYGGCAVLEDQGWNEVMSLTKFYIENGVILKQALNQKKSCEVFAGTNTPYLWVRFPGQRSWDLFDKFLNELHLITTPGSGFGLSGEGFLRFSTFGSRSNILKAAKRLSQNSLKDD